MLLAGTFADAGLREHEISWDEVEHAKFTVPVNPFTEEAETLKFVDAPAVTVADVGLTEGLKSHTCSCAVAVCVMGALTPVTVI